jgi:hypothetical protein
MLARLLDKFATWALSKNPGGPYAGTDDKRWAWTAETPGAGPYMTRILSPWRVLGIKPMINRFLREDSDRHLHNHPWKWALSIVLCGSYDETRLAADAEDCQRLYAAAGGDPTDMPADLFTRSRRVRRFNLLRASDYHRVTRLHGRVWTFFITGPAIQDWGFLINGKHVPWSKYLKRGQQ